MQRRRGVPICDRCSRVEADAVIWNTDDLASAWTCLLCPRQRLNEARTIEQARERATSHLDHTHGLLRVWIVRDRPEHAAAVQLAMPLALSLKHRGRTRHDA